MIDALTENKIKVDYCVHGEKTIKIELFDKEEVFLAIKGFLSIKPTVFSEYEQCDNCLCYDKVFWIDEALDLSFCSKCWIKGCFPCYKEKEEEKQ